MFSQVYNALSVQDATYEPVLCQTSSFVTTNALFIVELDSKGLPVVDNLRCDAELDMLKATKSLLIALLVILASKSSNNEAMYSLPFIVTGLKQMVFDGKPAIVIAISTATERKNDSATLCDVDR